MRYPKFLGAVFGLASVAAAQPATAAPTSTPVPGLSAAGDSIARAADGSMWLTEPAAPGRVARVATDGTITEYTGGVTANFTPNRAPDGLAITPDGYAWFLMHGGSSEVARISLNTGTVYRYLLTSGTPTSIAAGSDGKLWLTAQGDSSASDFISRYTRTDGTTKSFTTGLTAQTEPRSMISGADGALWFVEGGGAGRVGRITIDGDVTYRAVGGAPGRLGVGPGSSLWFSRDTELGSIGADTTSLFATTTKPAALATGPDDALWSAGTGGIVRVAPDGQVTTHPAGLDPSAKGTGLAAGADGRMWMTLDRAPFLVKITVPPRTGALGGSASSPTAATVTASVRANGLPTSASLQLRDAGGDWTTLSETAVGNGTSDVPVQFDVDHLAPDTTHTLRVVATNDAGPAVSAETSIRTPEAPLADPDPEPTTPEPTTPEPTTPEPTTAEPEPEPTLPEPEPTTPEPTTPQPTSPEPTLAATTPPPVEAPAEPGPTAEPTPVQGQTVVVRSDRGTVRYRVPGSTEYRDVDSAASIPTSSIIDTTRGAILLSSEIDGRVQQGLFSGGEFKVKQVKATGMTQLYLKGALDCTPGNGITAQKSAAKKKRRHIWGKDSGGRFETHGKDSVATVRGTKWLTTDTCDGTVVKVYEGAVSVKPRNGNAKAVLVKAGGRHFTPRAK